MRDPSTPPPRANEGRVARGLPPAPAGSAALLVLLLAAPLRLGAEPVAVPGGPAAVRRLLDLDPARPDRELFGDVARALLASGGDPSPRGGRRETLLRFAEDLAEWRRAPGCPSRLSARGDAWKPTRRALEWLGYRVRGDGPGFEAEPRADAEAARRQAFLHALGHSATDVLRALSAGEEVAVECPDGTAELPFGLAAWRETLGLGEKDLPAGDAFLRFVREPRAARMLLALLSVDADAREELRTIAGRPGGWGGWKLLHDEALDGFSRFPEALEVRDGRAILPGGPGADAAWADVVGAEPSDLPRFAVRLYAAGSGKAAAVVDALRRLPEEDARAFVLGTVSGVPAVERFRDLYAAIDAAGRRYERAPRDAWDFAQLAPSLRFGPGGELLVPGGAGLLREALEGGPLPRDEGELETLLARAREEDVDREEVLRRLVRGGTETTVAAFPPQRRWIVASGLAAARPVLADPGAFLLLFRGMDRFAGALAPLEELPLEDTAAVRRWLLALGRIASGRADREAELRAGLLVASAELLAGTYRSGALPPGRARDLFRDLVALPLFGAGRGGVAEGIGAFDAWLHGGLLAALREGEARFLEARRGAIPEEDLEWRAPRPAPTPDDLLAAALAGWRAPVELPFRGGRYSYDPTADGAARRREVARSQEHVPLAGLDHAARARDEALRLARAGDAAAAREAVTTLLDELAGLAAERDEDPSVVESVRAARYPLALLQNAKPEEAAAIVEAGLLPFQRLRAERTLEALVLHLYASAAFDPADLPFFDPRFVKRHELSWGGAPAALPASPLGPTRIVAAGEGRPLHLAGAFPGLGEALGLLHADGLVHDARGLLANERVRAGLVAPVAYLTPARLDDDLLLHADRACRATEQLAAALAERPEPDRRRAWRELAGDLVPPVRRNGLAVAAPGEIAAYLAPSDLYRIGRRLESRPAPIGIDLPAAREAREARERLVARFGPEGARERLAELGPRAPSWLGRGRLADLDLPPYERLAEYRLPDFFADRVYDLKLEAARAVVAAGDPAPLLPLLLAPALDELLAGARMAHAFDWAPIVRPRRSLDAEFRAKALSAALEAGRVTLAEAAP